MCMETATRRRSRGDGLDGAACVKKYSRFMTYQTGMLSLGNVDMSHGNYIYS